MLEFFVENYGTIIVGVFVLALVTAVAVKLIKDKINHKSSCACGCAGCPNAGACHKK